MCSIRQTEFAALTRADSGCQRGAMVCDDTSILKVKANDLDPAAYRKKNLTAILNGNAHRQFEYWDGFNEAMYRQGAT